MNLRIMPFYFRNLTILNIVILHFISVFIFTFVYIWFWNHNTSTFIIGTEINERAESIECLNEYDGANFKQSLPASSINEFNKKTAPLNLKIENYTKRQNQLNKICYTVKAKIDSISAILEKEYEENINQYVTYRTQDLINELAQIEKEIQSIDTFKVTNPVLANSKTKRLKLKQDKINRAISSIVQGIMNDASSNKIIFCREALYSENETLKHNLETYKKEVEKINKDLFTLKRDYVCIVENFHSSRNNKLSIIDFFYFSLLNSLSNNMGDIIPNCTEVRGVVCLQLFISLIWFALLIDKIIKKISRSS